MRSGCVHNVGYMGEGIHSSREYSKVNPVYRVWVDMLKRCYSLTYASKFVTYRGCTVHPDWHNFQVFAEWYTNNDSYGLGYELDKDILFKGNKVYSAETCCLVPKELNYVVTTDKGMKSDTPCGVSLTINNTYQSRISINGKRVSLGFFKSSDLAYEAYVTAKESHLKAKALEWQGRIEHKVFEALMCWTV